MIVGLDLALYARENDISAIDPRTKKQITLTPSLRGYAFTLMFRIGSNSHSWISQREWADEMGVDVRNLREAVYLLELLKIIEVMVDPKDKRNRFYRPHKKLINYHLKGRTNTKKLSTEKPSRVTNEKKYRTKTSGINPEYRMKTSGTTGRKHPVLNCTNTLTDRINPKKKSVDVHTKRTLKQHKDKTTTEKSGSLVGINEIFKTMLSEDEMKMIMENKKKLNKASSS